VSRRRIILRREIPGDLLDIHDYLARDSTEVAVRFLHSARATMRRLASAPGIGSPKPFFGKLKGLRSWAVEGFPNHLIYYKVSPGAIIVLGILHGSRDVGRELRTRQP